MIVTSNSEAASGVTGTRDALRVAVISDALKDRNGVDAYYRDLVSHLQERVAEVLYLTPNPEDGDWYTRFRWPLPGDSTQKLVLPDVRALNRRLDELQPHVIVAATNGLFGLYAVYAARRSKVPLVVGFHTLIEDLCKLYWGRGLFGRISKAYMEFQNRLIFRGASRVVVNSQSMIESAVQLAKTPVTLMGTPVERQFVERPRSPHSGQLQRIVFAGRLAPEKNIDSLIDAARARPDLQFTIAGDGPLREEIARQAEALGNLDFRGRLPREAVVDLIDEHDLLVLPSQLEAFGTIALEAMMRERPVLVSSHCGILSWEALASQLYQFEPEEALADALTRLESVSTETLNRQLEGARNAALELHTQAIDGWLDLFTGIAEQ